MWHFLKFVLGKLSPGIPAIFPCSSINRFCQSNPDRMNSHAVLSHHVAYVMLHVINTQCVPRDLHTIAQLLREFWCRRQLTAQ